MARPGDAVGPATQSGDGERAPVGTPAELACSTLRRTDQSRAPLLEALDQYHRLDRFGFTPPAHRQGRGIDDRVREIMGVDPFRDDVLASSGLDDRSSSGAYLQQAEELVAKAVDAEHAFFSTGASCCRRRLTSPSSIDAAPELPEPYRPSSPIPPI